MNDLATTIVKDFSQTYYDKVALMNGDELLQYNKSMELTVKTVGHGMSNAIAFNMAVKKGGLKFRIESRKGYKLITYYI